MIDWLTTAFTWDNFVLFMNSNFTAALAGAFAGAMAAQTIADRAKQREHLLTEIRSTNAAIMAAFSICNAALSLKKQLVKEIFDTYTAQRYEFEESKKKLIKEVDVRVYKFQLDLRTVQMPQVPIDALNTLMYEKVSSTGRPLATIAALSGSVGALSEVIQKRTDLIERFRDFEGEHSNLIAMYFGHPYGQGHISEEYRDSITAMYNLTDDVIFFSELLVTDLMTHGRKTLGQYKKISKVKTEMISSADFTDARREGLMPDPANYSNWVQGFQSANE